MMDSVRSKISNQLKYTFMPLFLILAAPNWSMLMLYLSVHHGGGLQPIYNNGFWKTFLTAWKSALVIDTEILLFLLFFLIYAILSIYCLGGKEYQGPPTKSGHIPVYWHSGFRYFVLSLAMLLVIFTSEGFSAVYWFSKLEILCGWLQIFGLLACLMLLIKGKFCKSPGEFSSSGNYIFDFYWGLELYPRLGKVLDIKLLTNSRFGLMLWQIIVLLSWKAQIELYGWNWSMAITSILQTIYLGKFYWWEDGYMKSLDIILDHAGFYICWGCIYFVPTFYTLTSVYMVHNSPVISLVTGLLYLTIGTLLVVLNYWADYQRYVARATDGNCKIWGARAKMIRAKYIDDNAKERNSLLLTSGFWGLSRHINYLFELASAFMWAFPANFTSFIPYTYFGFLLILLFHRSLRDDKKCQKKYGKYWKEYCKISKYRIVPLIY